MPTCSVMCSSDAVTEFLMVENPYTDLSPTVTEPGVVALQGWDGFCNSEEFKTNIACALCKEFIDCPNLGLFAFDQMLSLTNLSFDRLSVVVDLERKTNVRPEAYIVGDYCNVDGSHNISAFIDSGEVANERYKRT